MRAKIYVEDQGTSQDQVPGDASRVGPPGAGQGGDRTRCGVGVCRVGVFIIVSYHSVLRWRSRLASAQLCVYDCVNEQASRPFCGGRRLRGRLSGCQAEAHKVRVYGVICVQARSWPGCALVAFMCLCLCSRTSHHFGCVCALTGASAAVPTRGARHDDAAVSKCQAEAQKVRT